MRAAAVKKNSCEGNTFYVFTLKARWLLYDQFNIHKLYVLPTQCIYVFCVDLRTNSDYFPIQH